jgi:hypothetical protein
MHSLENKKENNLEGVTIMNLYKIANEYQEVLSKTFDPETGEVNEAALSLLDITKGEVKEKSIAVASYIKNLEAEKIAIQSAKDAMGEREKRLANRLASLSDYLHSNMERCGINEISSPYFVIKLKKNPVSVDDYNHDLIPNEYKKTVTEIKIDKRKIKEELQAGVVIPGATLKQSTRLEIR